MRRLLVDLNTIVIRSQSPDEEERQRALIALFRSSDIRAIPALKRMAASDPNVKLRYMARKAIYILQKLMSEGMSEEEKKSELFRSGLIAEPERASQVTFNPAILERILLSKDDGKKVAALQAAVRYSATEALPVLERFVGSEQGGEVRATLVITLGILGGERQIDSIIPFLEDPDNRVRANAVEALEFIGHPSVYPHITRLLPDMDNRIRANVIKALRNYGKVNLKRLLEEMLVSSEVWMRDSAVYTLGALKQPEYLPLLEQATKDVDSGVRKKALRGIERLARQGDPTAVQSLKTLSYGAEDDPLSLSASMPAILAENDGDDRLAHSDPTVRKDEIARINREQDRLRLPALAGRLDEEADPFIRAFIITVLGTLGGPEVEGALAKGLRDEAPRVRANAIESLVAIDAPHLVELVTPHLQGENNRVKANAIVALKGSGAVDILTPLAELIYSSVALERKSGFYALTDVDDARVYHFLQSLVEDPDEDLRHKAREFLAQLLDQGNPFGKEIYRKIRKSRPSLDLDVQAASSARRLVGGGGEEAVVVKTMDLGGDEGEDGRGGQEGEGEEETGKADAEQALPAPPPIASTRTRKTFRYAVFRNLSVDRKKELLRDAKNHRSADVYYFLKEVEQKEAFDIKVLAKVALKSFSEEQFGGGLFEDEEGETRFLWSPEPQTVEYQGLKTLLQLNQDLAGKAKRRENAGSWSGPFDPQFQILNGLREDSQDMIVDILGDDKLERVSLCYFHDKLRRFLEGHCSLDANRYAPIVKLSPVINRIDLFATISPFLRSVKSPIYLLVILTDRRCILFLRGPLMGRVCKYLSVPYHLITRIERKVLHDLVTLQLQVGQDFIELPELEARESEVIHATLKKESIDKIKSEERFIDIDFQDELKKLDLLKAAGALSEAEFKYRRDRILKMDEEKFSRRNVEKILTRRYKDEHLAARVDEQLLKRFKTELTIMFTDIVGYSKKAAANQVLDTVTILAIHDSLLLPKIRDHAGNLVKKIGDALMVSFKDPCDAVRAALAMQDALARFNQQNEDEILIRIGLNTGEVFQREGDVFGHAVNQAARMENFAEPGTILVSQRSSELISGEFECHDEGVRELKGTEERMQVYSIVRPAG